MKRSYRITPQAQSDLREIGLYTLRQWGKKQKDAYIFLLKARVELLADNPRLGKTRNDIRPGFMCFPAGDHLIFYKIRPDNIDVIGVLHTRMDPIKHFRES